MAYSETNYYFVKMDSWYYQEVNLPYFYYILNNKTEVLHEYFRITFQLNR